MMTILITATLPPPASGQAFAAPVVRLSSYERSWTNYYHSAEQCVSESYNYSHEETSQGGGTAGWSVASGGAGSSHAESFSSNSCTDCEPTSCSFSSYASTTWPAPPSPGTTYQTWTSTCPPNDYSFTDDQVPQPLYPWHHVAQEEDLNDGYVDGDPESGNYGSYTNRVYYRDSASSAIELLTNGEPGSSDSLWYLLEVSVVDDDSGAPLPNDQIQVLGQAVSEDGTVLLQLAQNQTFDVTPSVPAAVKNYSYSVGASTVKFRIRLNGVEATGATNTVVVGQQIWLSCELDGGFAFSNVNWTLPGAVVGGFTADATSGGAVPLLTSALTSTNFFFYWVDGGAKDVVCTAVRDGQPLQAQTTVMVQQPTATLNAIIGDNIAADVNTNSSGMGTPIGLPWLHFGRGYPAGIYFDAFGFDHNGFAGQGEWFYAQVAGQFVIEHNLANGTSIKIEGSGVDTKYPYPPYPPIFTEVSGQPHLYSNDSPQNALLNDAVACRRIESYTITLMFKPNLPSAIPVPVKKVIWSWSGIATNNAGVWFLTSPSSPPAPQANLPAPIHPTWSQNVTNRITTTNASWFQ